ncbi:MAG: SGNH/GDSL hydrolase family protein [Mycobacteriales bacterium]
MRSGAPGWRDRALPLLAVLGDSTAQRIGASAFDHGWVGPLARGLAESGQPRRVVTLPVGGARTGDLLAGQLAALEALDPPADTVVAVVGANDLRHTPLPAGSSRSRSWPPNSRPAQCWLRSPAR